MPTSDDTASTTSTSYRATPPITPNPKSRKKWPMLSVAVLAFLGAAFLTKSILFSPSPVSGQTRVIAPVPASTTTATVIATTTQSSMTSASTSVQYLLFQSFWGAQNPHVAGLTSDSNDESAPLPWDQATYRADLEQYVDTMKETLGTITLAPGKEYGFSVGPLTLEQTDQDLEDSIATAFSVALEKQVAVGFHLDVSHYWRFVRGADGAQLSSLRGAQDVRAWQSWQGAIAPGDPWDFVGTLMPSMCFECQAVKAMADYKASQVIGPAIAAGIARLDAAGEENLFAGLIVGWEAGSTNAIDYHSLTVEGYSAAHPPASLVDAQQQVLNDYLARWTSDLSAFMPQGRLYTHIGGPSQDPNSANVSGFDSEAFTPYGQGGFSMYPQSASDFEAIWSAAQKAHRSWALVEGVDVTLTGRGNAMASPITWETYLGSVFNHGGTLANILGAFLPQPAGVFTTACESTDAMAAYRTFLTGGTLVETKGTESLPDKVHKIESLAPAYLQAHPDNATEVQSMYDQIVSDVQNNDIADAVTAADQLLQLIGAR